MNREEALETFWVSEAGAIGEAIVHEIYDDFESRTCENCKHWSKEKKQCLNVESIAYTSQEAIYYDDGCNKFVRKVSS